MLNPEPSAQPTRIPLYHYSDGNGFLGMLNTGKLWFTHIKYLNDSAEYSYALTKLAEVLKEYKDVDEQGHLQQAFEVISDNERLQSHYSFSLTEEDDLLSQWRGYCPNGGYSFSFDSQHIDQMCTTYNLAFKKCLYTAEDQRQFIIDEIIDVPLASIRQAVEGTRENTARGILRSKGVALMTYNIHLSIINRAHLLAFIKDPTFAQEQEWRIVASEKSMQNINSYLKYRSSRNMLIPYLDLPIPLRPDNEDPQNNLIINKVRISPTAHKDLALASCRMMMSRYQC
jgi:hypothetical protein